MTNYDDMKFAIESATGGRNTVILDDLGKPSIMVVIPKMKYSDIIDGGSDDTLPCFIVDDVELDQIYVSKYMNIIENDRAYSLPNQDPAVGMTFDTALEVCRNKGAGWALMPNGLWGAIQGFCLKNGHVPHGNTNYGCDYNNPHEKGIPTYKSGTEVIRTGTGTGPASWNHDNTIAGISDLCGNVWEWCSGLRTRYGQIQIIPDGNCMKADCNMGLSSSEWKAITSSGSLVSSGSSSGLRYRYVADDIMYMGTTEGTLTGAATYFSEMKNSTTIPDLARALGLFPISNREYGRGYIYNRISQSEYIPVRSGGSTSPIYVGLPAMSISYSRSTIRDDFGFRSVYYEAV